MARFSFDLPNYFYIGVVLLITSMGCTFREDATQAVQTPTSIPLTPTQAPTPSPIPAPTDTPTALPPEIYESEGLGIKIGVPAGWAVKESIGWDQLGIDDNSWDLAISPYFETLQNSPPFPGEFNGSAMILFLGDLLYEGEGTEDDPVELLKFSLAWFLLGENFVREDFIREPEALEINGVEAARASVRVPNPDDNRDEIWVWAVIKQHWSNVIWVIGIDGTDDGRYEEAILESIQSLEFTNVEQIETTRILESSQLGIEVEIPTHWLYEESEGTLEIAAHQFDTFYDSANMWIVKPQEIPPPEGSEGEGGYDDALVLLLDLIASESEEKVLIQDPAENMIDGNQFAVAVARDDAYFDQLGGATFVYAVIRYEGDQFLIVFGEDGTEDGRYTELMLKIIESIRFSSS